MKNHLMQVPLSPDSDEGALQFLGPVPQHNYALNEGLRQLVKSELVPLMEQVRNDRLSLENEWLEIVRMSAMQHGELQAYFGRSNSYLPVYRKTRDTLVRNLSRGLFPSDEWFDVVDKGTGDPEQAKPVKAYMRWEMEKVARIRSYLKPFLAQLADFGTSPLKFTYRREMQMRGRARRNDSMSAMLRNLGMGSMAPQAEMAVQPIYEGLQVSPRSLFNWFIYPVTAETVDDAVLVFEDIAVPLAYVKAMIKNGTWKGLDASFSGSAEPNNFLTNEAVVLDARGGHPQPSSQYTGALGTRVVITEAWTYLPMPASAYLPGETAGQPVPLRIVIVNGEPVQITRNPYYHQCPPYVVGRIGWEAGFFYGSAAGRTVKPLQALANDFTNQTNDNGIFALNPMAIFNPALMVGVPGPMRPGGVWWATDVEKAARFDRPPWEQVQVGMHMVDRYVGMSQDFAGAPPILQGTGSKGTAKTATGSSILQKNATSELQDVVEDVEIDVLIPLLMKSWMNSLQYRKEEVIATVAGERIPVTPEQLAIQADFFWLASSQAVNSQMRAQAALNLINSVAPLLAPIMQQGYVVDFVALIKKVYTDGLGYRGFHEFIRKAQAAPGAMPGMQIPQSQYPGVVQEQGDRVRSALEQVNGQEEAPDMAPGEGEDFMEVRGEADQLAAMLGGLGGGQ